MALKKKTSAAEAKSRLVHISLMSLNLRLMENWRAVQIAMAGNVLDYESTMIIMAIIVISAERLLRSELELELQTLEKRMPEGHLSRVNLSSIAAATAINRETVRRKVNELQASGLVVRNKEGIRMAHGLISYDLLRKVITTQLEAITQTTNQLARLGVLVTRLPPDG